MSQSSNLLAQGACSFQMRAHTHTPTDKKRQEKGFKKQGGPQQMAGMQEIQRYTNMVKSNEFLSENNSMVEGSGFGCWE